MKRTILVCAIVASLLVLFAAAGPQRVGKQNAERVARRAEGSVAAVTGWTTPVNISNTGAESRAPVIDLDSAGNAYVIWQDWTAFYGAGGPRQTMFNTNKTGQWQSSATLIHNQAYIAIDDSGFPTVVVNPSGTKIVVLYHDADYTQYLMQVFYRAWANGAWGSDNLNYSQAPAPCEYPAAAFSPIDDSLYCLFMADVGPPFELAMRYVNGPTGAFSSTDVTNILSGASKYLYLTKQMKFDPSGVLHTVFTTHSQAWYAKNSTPKNLNSWSAAVNLSGETGLGDTNPRLAVDNNGEAYAVWEQKVSGNMEIMFRKTVNGVWQAAENLSQTANDSEVPAIAVNRTNGDIYVAWQEDNPGNAEVFLKTYELQSGSTRSWSANINFSSSSGPSGEPYLNSDPSGAIHLVYVDTPSGASKPEIMYSVKPSGPKPPVSVTLSASLDSTETRKVDTLTWQANPDNTQYTISNFKIYRKAGGADFALLTTVSASTLTYQDTNLEPATTYAYKLTSVSNDGREGAASAAVDDNQDFLLPPARVTLSVAINKILFSQTKNITVTWAANPLVRSANIAGYELYSRLVGQSDDLFALMTSTNASTFSYSYTIKPPSPVTQKYAFALKTVFKSGAKSGLSKVVAEQ